MVRFPEETRIPPFLQSALTGLWASPYSSFVCNRQFILGSTVDPKWTNRRHLQHVPSLCPDGHIHRNLTLSEGPTFGSVEGWQCKNLELDKQLKLFEYLPYSDKKPKNLTSRVAVLRIPEKQF